MVDFQNRRSNRKNKEVHTSWFMGENKTKHKLTNKMGSGNGCMNSGVTEFQDKKCFAWGIQSFSYYRDFE